MLAPGKFEKLSPKQRLRHMASECVLAIQKCQFKEKNPNKPISVIEQIDNLLRYGTQVERGEEIIEFVEGIKALVPDYPSIQNKLIQLHDNLLALSGFSLSEKSFHIRNADVVEKRRTEGIYVILDNIRSAFNVGCILRTCDASCVKKVFFCGYTATPGNPKLEKTALGATKTIEWEQVDSVFDAIEAMREQGVKVYAMETADPSEDIFSAQIDLPVALVLGNEMFGLSPSVLSNCDGCLEIPMFGQKNSLNVSCAFSIAVYSVLQHANVVSK